MSTRRLFLHLSFSSAGPDPGKQRGRPFAISSDQDLWVVWVEESKREEREQAEIESKRVKPAVQHRLARTCKCLAQANFDH